MKILIVQLGRIGDSILMTPIITAIKEKYPDSRINILIGKDGFPALKSNPFVSDFIVWDKSPLKILTILFKLIFGNYDYLIDPKDHFSRESKIISRITGSKYKIGFNKSGKRVFDFSVPSSTENEGQHYIQRCFNALKFLNIELPDAMPRPVLYTSPLSDSYLASFEFSKLSTFIVINISASQPHKMWQKEKWIEFINHNKNHNNFVLTCAPAERLTAKEIFDACPGISYFESRSMEDVISLISRCRMLITPDTSLVHVASAFNKPLISLYSGLESFYLKFHPTSDCYKVIKAADGDIGIAAIETITLDEVFKEFMSGIN